MTKNTFRFARCTLHKGGVDGRTADSEYIEKSILSGLQNARQKMEECKIEAHNAERSGDYGKVAEIRYGKMPELQSEIDDLTARQKAVKDPIITEAVTPEDIAEVVSKWTGIPVRRMVESEKEKLLRMETELHKRVVGQSEAIEAVSDAVRRSRAGLQNEKRPIGSFPQQLLLFGSI